MFKITGPMQIKYTDDEGDLCTITTQPELDFAVTLNPSLLRLSITAPNVIALVPLRAVPVAQAVKTQPTPDCQAPHPMHQKWTEIFERKTARLTEKQTRLQTKLAETNEPERQRFLKSKLERVQQKLAFFESRKQCMYQGPQHNQERPWRAHGGQRGCWKRENNQHDGKTMPEHPFHHPHHMMHHPHHLHNQTFPRDQQEREQRWIGFLEKRTQVLTENRESIQMKLAGENLSPERRRFLEEKLGRIQQKLVNMENKKQHLSQQEQSGQENSHPCKGRGRRCGRFSECQKNPETQ
jgi:hypothetical protein